MQMNYRSSVFAELDRRCHSGSSRLRQIIFTNLRKAYLLHRTFRNIGDLLFQVKPLSRNQIYRAFSFDVSAYHHELDAPEDQRSDGCQE